MCTQKYHTAIAERLCPYLSTTNTSLPILGEVEELFEVSKATNTAKESPAHVQTTRITLSHPVGEGSPDPRESGSSFMEKFLFLGLSDSSAQVLNCRLLPEARYPTSS